jgi:hypothetical protein
LLLGLNAAADDNNGNPSNSAQLNDGNIPGSSRQPGQDFKWKSNLISFLYSISNKNNIGEAWWQSVGGHKVIMLQNYVVWKGGTAQIL